MISRVVKDDVALKQVLGLLEKCKLPFKDVALGKGSLIAYYNEKGKLVGSGGLEFYGQFSLLRSLAVSEDERAGALGTAIARDLVARSKDRFVKKVFLLTETAPAFFTKLGFKEIARGDVPDEVKTSSEFSSVCPESAICMMLQL